MKALKIVSISLAGASMALSIAATICCIVDINKTRKRNRIL